MADPHTIAGKISREHGLHWVNSQTTLVKLVDNELGHMNETNYALWTETLRALLDHWTRLKMKDPI